MEQETFAISTDDPFPKNEAKVAVVDFDNFGLTYQDSTIYQLKPVQATSTGTTTMEREFNLFSTKSINSGKVDPYTSVRLFSFTKSRSAVYYDLKQTVKNFTKNLKGFDPKVFEDIQIKTNSNYAFDFPDQTVTEFNYFSRVVNFRDQEYNPPAADYLYDKTNTIYPVFINNGSQGDSICLVLEKKQTDFFLYRFESFDKSLLKKWYVVLSDAELFASKLSIIRSQHILMKSNNTVSESLQENSIIANVSVLPMYGGYAFSNFNAHSKYEISKVIAWNIPELRRRLMPQRKVYESEKYTAGFFDAGSLGVTYFYTSGGNK